MCGSVVSGCGENPKGTGTPQPQTPSAEPSDPNQFTWDAGTVLAGEVITANFTVQNDMEEPISILADDKDIKPNCGCSGLKPEIKIIEAKCSTAVAVTVDTTRRSGRFSVGGDISWTAESGAKRITHFSVTGSATPPLRAEPEALHFSADDLAAGRFQELKVSSAVHLDWDELRAEGGTPSVRFGLHRREGDSLIVPVTCDIPASIEMLQDNVSLSAPVNDPTSPLRGKRVSVNIAVSAFRKVDFAVSPNVVVVTETGGRASAKLLVHGRLVKNGAGVIRGVCCDSGRVQWTMSQPSASGVALIELNFERSNEKPTELQMEVVGMDQIHLPISWAEVRPGTGRE
jgi:hypothetical protein